MERAATHVVNAVHVQHHLGDKAHHVTRYFGEPSPRKKLDWTRVPNGYVRGQFILLSRHVVPQQVSPVWLDQVRKFMPLLRERPFRFSVLTAL